jgi:hypothetical protein
LPGVPEDFDYIHTPYHVAKSMERKNISPQEMSETVHYPDRLNHNNMTGGLAAERDVEDGSTIRVVYVVRHRPADPRDAEWEEIKAAMVLVGSTVDPEAAAVVKHITRIRKRS